MEYTEAEQRHKASKHRLLIDLSSIARASHQAGTDHEFGKTVFFEEKQHQVNSARYCYNIFMTSYLAVLERTGLKPFQTVLVKDGKDSRRLRRLLYSQYKAKRANRPQEMHDEYNEALRLICADVLAMGGTVMEQEGMEADDVLAYLSTGLEGLKTIWSRDGDMLALRSTEVQVLLKDEMNPQIHHAAPAKYVLLYKALVGDTSDNLPGAKGFGEGAFTKLVLKYGYDGLDQLEGLIKNRQLQQLVIDGDVNEFKPLQKVVDGAEEVYASYACAKFYSHRVNTKDNPLVITTGKVEQWDPTKHNWAFREFYGTKLLLGTANFVDAVDEVHAQLRQSPWVALDVEASDTDEGAAWAKRIDESKKGSKSNTVDVFGQVLAGMSLTFGDNLQHTVYMPVDHADTENNLSVDQVHGIVNSISDKLIVIQNTGYELQMLYRTWNEWLPNVIDTVDMKSYVDENTPLGLKQSSKMFFNYDQVSYAEVTGGLRMNQLTSAHVFDYGCDDTICTSALFNRYEFTMELEGTYSAFRQCELIANYWVAQAYVDGVDVDFALLKELEREDDLAYAATWSKLREYLFKLNWKGTFYEPYDLSPASIKKVFKAITGNDLDCRARLTEKIAQAVADQGLPELSVFISEADEDGYNEFIQNYWSPEPEFSMSKKSDLRELMYDVLKLPIRFRTRVTDAQKAKGVEWGQGTPQVDAAAVEHALKLDTQPEDDGHQMLLQIRQLNSVETRKKLYYKPYPLYAHWKDGKIHASLGKNFTSTRRFASNGPNWSQLPKKGEGLKIRTTLVAPEGCLVVPMDEESQEMRLMAEESGDVALVSCFVGDNKKDPHSLTGSGIAARDSSPFGDYDTFMQNIKDPKVKVYRAKGKGTNFATSYLCRAKKLAQLLTVAEDEAQKFLDAKNTVFFGLAQWQQDVIAQAHAQGYVTTRLGARRHLHHKLSSSDKWRAQEAERQAVNFTIQGSGCEMIKLAINKMFTLKLRERFGVKVMFPVHDEVVITVPTENACQAIPEIHACMVQNYGGMKLPLGSECKLGQNFGHGLVVIGSIPSEENIKAALEIMNQANALPEDTDLLTPEIHHEEMEDEVPDLIPYH